MQSYTVNLLDMKTMLSILIIVIKPNRTQSNAYSRIRQLKIRFHSAVDDEKQIFLSFQAGLDDYKGNSWRLFKKAFMTDELTEQCIAKLF